MKAKLCVITKNKNGGIKMKNKLFAFLVCCFILLSAGFNVVAEVVPADAGPLPSYFESSDGQFF